MSMTREELVSAIKEASKLGYFGGMGSGKDDKRDDDSSEKTAKAGKNAEAAGSAFADLTGKLTTGGARVSDASAAIAKGFSVAGDQGSKFGTALAAGSAGLNKLGQNLDQNIDTWRKLSDTGLSFGNDIMAMKTQASDARLSIAEMSEVLQKSNASMLGFGVTSAASAKQLSKMSNEFFTSGLGEELRGMGYTTKELNEVLAVSISGSKIKDLNDDVSRAKALKSASALATEMDAVAKITGQSKQDQLDELRRKATDGQRMAAIDEAIANGKEGAKEAFDAITTNGKLMGPQFQKLAEDMASMGRPSEGMEQAYGLLSSGAKKLMSEAGDAARSGNRERAAELTKQAAAEQAAFQQTSQYRTMAAQAGIKETQESYAQGAKFRNALEQAGKELGPMAGSSEKTALALKKLDEQVAKEQQAGGDKDTAKTAGTEITRFAVNLESRGRDLTKVLNDEVIQPLATKTGPAIAALNAKLGGKAGIDMIQSQLAEPMARTRLKNDIPSKDGQGLIADKMRSEGITEKDKSYPDIKKLNDLISKPSTSDATAQALSKIAAAQGIKPEEVIAAAMKNKGAGVAALNTQLNEALPEPIKKVRAQEEKTGEAASPTINRATNREAGIEPTGLPGAAAAGVGALGDGITSLTKLFTTGDAKVTITNTSHATGGVVTKPEISLIGEAGPEAIFNKGQLEEYTAKVMGSAAGAMPKFDVGSISKSISTSISSVTGGGSTTTKQVQNDSSKAAEKELASVQEQMQAERAALREKLKAQMGDGSKLGGNAVAKELRTGDEGKAIAEKYKAMMEPLQKQIDAGISVETTKKAAAIEETTKMVSEQIAITKTSNSTLADMYKDDSKSKLDLAKKTNADAFKEAELAKSVIGTSVKGMSDDMIEAMIPKGAKIEDYYIDMNDKIQSNSADFVANMEKNAKASTSVIETYSTTISSSSKKMAGDIAGALPGATNKTAAAPAPMSMASMSVGMDRAMLKTDDQKKVFDEIMTLNDTASKAKKLSLQEEMMTAHAANKAATEAIDLMEEKLDAEGKGFKDLTGKQKEEYEALRKQQNESFDASDKAREAIKAVDRAEQAKQNLQKMGYDVVVKQEEDKTKIIEASSEKIKADISDALPVKEVAAQQQEFKSQFTESQQKIIDDYKGYSEENRSFHAQAMESGIKEDTKTAEIIGNRIAKMKAEIGDRQATKEEEAALENETLNKAMFERQVEKKKEMLDVMQNLGDYSAKREQELKEKAAKDAIAITAAIEDKKTDAIKSDIKEALPVDAEFGDLDGAIARNKADDEAKSELARESRRGVSVIENKQEGKLIDSPKSKMMSATDMMAGGLSFGANGMPIMKSIDAAKKSISPAKDADADRENAKFKRQAEEKKAEAAKVDEKKPAATKESTLSDVVSQLNTLNKQMGQLLVQHEDLGRRQVNATKGNNSNILAR